MQNRQVSQARKHARHGEGGRRIRLILAMAFLWSVFAVFVTWRFAVRIPAQRVVFVDIDPAEWNQAGERISWILLRQQ